MKTMRFIALFLVLCMFSTLLLACDQVNVGVNIDNISGGSVSTDDVVEVDKIMIGSTSIEEYNIVYAKDAPNSAVAFANNLAAWVKETVGVELKILDDTSAATAYEILIGDTNRSESVGAAFNAAHEFNVNVKNGKLSVRAQGKNGYNLAYTTLTNAITSNNGVINKSLSNNKLSYTDIKALSVGCTTFSTTEMGLHFCKSTQKQIDAWTNYTKTWTSNKECAKYSTGCRLDFDTDSSYFYFKVTDGKECVVLINGEQVVQSISSHFQFLDNSNGSNHVTILLPSGTYYSWALEEFEVDANSNTKLHDFDLNVLFLGDSITEGYNNYGNVANTYTFQLSQHLNAHSVVQGNSGAQFWVDMLDPAMADLYQPDIIIVSLGTNDWSSRKDSWTPEQFNEWCDSYLDKLRTIYPDTPIVGITPIYRMNQELEDHKAPFSETMLAYKQAFEDHGAYVVNGVDLVPHDMKYYADNVHPNGVGFIEYGKNLYEAIKDYVAEVMAE